MKDNELRFKVEEIRKAVLSLTEETVKLQDRIKVLEGEKWGK